MNTRNLWTSLCSNLNKLCWEKHWKCVIEWNVHCKFLIFYPQIFQMKTKWGNKKNVELRNSFLETELIHCKEKLIKVGHTPLKIDNENNTFLYVYFKWKTQIKYCRLLSVYRWGQVIDKDRACDLAVENEGGLRGLEWGQRQTGRERGQRWRDKMEPIKEENVIDAHGLKVSQVAMDIIEEL